MIERSDYSIAVFVYGQDYGIINYLSKQGYNINEITASQLVERGLNTGDYDLLLLTNSPYYPVEAEKHLLNFIKDGGDLFLMGGAAFSKKLWQKGDSWLTLKEMKKLNIPLTEKQKGDITREFYEVFEDYEV